MWGTWCRVRAGVPKTRPNSHQARGPRSNAAQLPARQLSAPQIGSHTATAFILCSRVPFAVARRAQSTILEVGPLTAHSIARPLAQM